MGRSAEGKVRTPGETVFESTDRALLQRWFSQDPTSHLELLDESVRGVDGLVSAFFVGDPASSASPRSFLAVRWGQAALGLGHLATLGLCRVADLACFLPLPAALGGRVELSVPFWASSALGVVSPDDVGVTGIYECPSAEALSRQAPAWRRCERVVDDDVLRPMFPKRVPSSPAFALAFGADLAAVAVVTHAWEASSPPRARLAVYTVDAHRGRGFGRAVLVALADELLQRGFLPSLCVDLGREPEVRLVEGAGFVQHRVSMRLRGLLRRDPPTPSGT